MRTIVLMMIALAAGCGGAAPGAFDGDAGGADGDTDADADGDADTDADADADGDADTDADTDADGDADTDADGDADTDADGDADTDADTDADGDADTDADTDADGDADTDSDTTPVASWWDCAWNRRAPIVIANAGSIGPGYSIRLTFDHAAAVAAGLSQAGGDDVRVAYYDGAVWTELDRVLDPVSSWDAVDTTIWFAAVGPLVPGPSSYALYHANPVAGPPPADEGAVFHFADFFDRPDNADPGNGWGQHEDMFTAVAIASNALYWEAMGDQTNRPVADRDFLALDGQLSWRLGFDWSRTGNEGTYRLHMQLGSAGNMPVPDWVFDTFANAGAGPSLVWAGPSQGMAADEGLGGEVGGTVSQSAILSGFADLEVRADVPGQTYNLLIDGTSVATGLAFSSNQTAVDRMRLFSYQMADANFAGKAFRYTIVRPVVDPEPTTTFGVVEGNGAYCN